MAKQNIPQLRFQEFDGEWEKSKLNKFASLNPKNSELPESFIYIDLESVTDGLLIKENVVSKSEAPSRAQRILKDKDILYQTVRPYQKNNLYFDKVGDYVASTGYAQIRTKNDSLFLFQFLHTEKFVTNVMLRCTGTSYPAINSSDLSSIEILFPTLPEQQKIASFLSAVDEKIQQLTRKAALLEKYKKGVMQQLFSKGAIHRDSKLRFKDDNGKDYPDWEEKKLGEVAKITMGQSPESKSYNTDSNGMLLIQGNADIKDRLTLPRQWTSEPTKTCEIGDLILTVRAPVGSIAKSRHNACIGRGVCSIKNSKNSIIEYLYQFFLSYESKWTSLEQGSTFTAVSGSDIKELKLNLPSIKEQQKIANFLSGIDSKIEMVNKQLAQTQTFKKGLLQQMFV